MDFSSIGFLLVIIIVGGVAGYVGDHLGKKLGKKRLSLMGLRPRHTAAVSTVAFGMFLSLLTILLVLLISAPVRQWILHGAESLAELKVVREQLGEAQPKLAKAKGELDRVQRQVESDKQTLESDQVQITSQKSVIARDKLFIDQTEQKLTASTQKLSAVNANLEQTTQSLNQEKAKEQTVAEENSKLGANILAQRKELGDLGTKLDKARRAAAYFDGTSKYLQMDFIQTRFQPMIFSRFQEVTRLPVDANLSPNRHRRRSTL